MANEFFIGRTDDEVGHLATVTVQSGTEDPDYPAALLADFTTPDVEAKFAKLTGTDGAWVLDFGAAQRIDVVVFWHNGVAALTMRFQGNASNSWGAPTVDGTFVTPAIREDGFTTKGFIDLRTVSGYSTTGLRYWRAVFPTNDIPVGLKILAYRAAREPDRAFRLGYHDADTHGSLDHRTEHRVPWIYDTYGVGRLLGGHLTLSASDLAFVRSWHRASHGHVLITTVVVDAAINDAFVGRWLNAPSITPVTGNGPGIAVLDPTLRPYEPTGELHEVDVAFEELTAGLPERD